MQHCSPPHERGAAQAGGPSSSRLKTTITPRHNSVNHRRNADESGQRGENGKVARRDERGREQAEDTKECNPTSSTPSPRVVAGRPLHGMKIASSALGLCWGLYLSSRTVPIVMAWLLNQTFVR